MARNGDKLPNSSPPWSADRVERGELQITPPQTPGTEGLLRLAIGVVIIAGLYFGKQVLIPITLAVLLSFVLSPVVAFLRRIRIPRAPAVILSVLLALGLIGTAGTVLGSQMASLSNDMPQYVQTIHTKINSAQTALTSHLSFLSEKIHSSSTNEKNAKPSTTEHAASALAPESKPAEGAQTGALATTFSILGSILGPFETFIIVLVVAIFILLQRDEVRDKTIRLMGSSDLSRTTNALEDAGRRLSKYLLSQLAVNTGYGVVIGLGTWFIGLPVPLVWGALAGMLRFVPYIGSLLGAVLPIIVAAAIDPGWHTVLYVALLFVIVEPLTGYALEPLLYGHSTGLSPLSIIIAAIFWTWIWGPVGLVLSMPLTLCLVVLGEHIPSLQFLAVLLGDQPVLSPVESLYQRMLSGNLADQTDQAAATVAESSLGEYYDTVILPSLKLAADDVRRNVISRQQAAELSQQLIEFTEDLAEETGIPAEPLGGSYILCVAGHGPLDQTASAMCAQLFRQKGIAARAIPNSFVSRRGIASLDLSTAKALILATVDPEARSARLRLLLQRLRHHTDLPIIVGFGDVDLPKIQTSDAKGFIVSATDCRDVIDKAVRADAP